MRPVHLNLKPSYLLAAILASAAISACIILAFMPLALELKSAVVVLVIMSTAYHVLDALLRLPWSLVGLELNSKGELHVRLRDGEKQSALVLGDSVVLSYLTILNLKISGRRWRRHMLVTPDRVEPDAFRQLRVWLHWGCQTISEAEAAEEV